MHVPPDQSRTSSKRVFVDDSKDLPATIRRALDFVQFGAYVKADTRVFLKPNLTWKEHLPGVTVSPGFLKVLVEAIKDYTGHITIGESAGGYNSFAAEAAFDGHGLIELSRRYGIGLTNLCTLDSERVTGVVGGTELTVNLPKLLLHDTDVFVTVPVPKVHSNTIVSLALKNQWGCIPDIMRLRQHSVFNKLIVLVNQVLRTRFAIFDGTFMLDVTGPLIGKAISKDLVIASNEPGTGSWACCQIMGIDPWRPPHHRVAQEHGLFPFRGEEVIVNRPLEPLCTHQFHLERNLVSWVSYSAFNSPLVTRLVYDSNFADACHKVLYAVRKNKAIGRVLYGAVGPPAIEGRRR